MSMLTIDEPSDNDPVPISQSDDGLGQPNPSTTDAIVRRGQGSI